MIFCAGIAAIFSPILLYSFNRMPTKWLCDYGESLEPWDLKVQLSLKQWCLPLWVFLFVTTSIFLYNSTLMTQFFAKLIILMLLLHICFADLSYHIIPDQHTACIFLMGIFSINLQDVLYHLLGFVAGVLPFLLMLVVGLLFKGNDVIGFGDIKLMGALGLFLGFSDIIYIYMTSSLISGFFSLILLCFKPLFANAGKVTHIPFAPFITIGFILCEVH